jgi:hypothetical protein
MFKDRGYGHIDISDNAFGFVYKCYLPKVGYGINSVTYKMEETDIMPKPENELDHFWERPTLPTDFKIRRNKEKQVQAIDPYYVDEYLEAIRRREWKRRLCGVWFWNYNPTTKESILEYITGLQYFYITYWRFQGKYMDFRIADRDIFYVIAYDMEDDKCLGPNEITKRKNGKCFKINTLIRMYDGTTKKVQDIKDGELVMGNDSVDRIVYGCTSGEEEMFDITPNKGDKFTVNRSHILHCIKTIYSSKTKITKRVPVNITVNDYLKLSKSAKHHLTLKRVGWGEWENKSHIVDPYFLGIWLGDGSSKSLQITNEDIEVVSYLKEYCDLNGLRYKNFGQESKSGNKLQHSISNKVEMNVSCLSDGEWLNFDNKESMMLHLGKHKKTPLKTFGKYKKGEIVINGVSGNKIWSSMVEYGLKQNKHIPSDYLIDGEENRLQLLAGLIDSDGTFVIHKNGNPGYFKIALSNNYPKLQDDLVELIRSLGFYCGIGVEKAANAKSFTIFGDIERIPTKIKRKQAWKYTRNYDSMLTGFKVESVGVDKYYGFAVDDNHLFLLADGTVVHNTARLGCWAYERVSRMNYHHAGLQSKSDTDAEEAFRKAVIHPWQKLPDFFRPRYDLMKGEEPSELRFFPTSRRGAKAELDDESIEEPLESFFDYKVSTESAYDGPEVHTYCSEEAGKTKKPVSIKERQNVVRFCTEIDFELKGKHFYTSTVEPEKNEEENYEFQELTANSNPLERDDNGFTGTGLYTYFLPAQKGMYINKEYAKYGYVDEEMNLDFLAKKIKALEEKNDTRGVSSFKRKNPRNLKEAFSADGEYALYNPELLNNQLDAISWTTKFTERGNLEWIDGYKVKRPIEGSGKINPDTQVEEFEFEPSEVQWVSDPNGKFEKVVGWMPLEPNKVYQDYSSFRPNNSFLDIGCDPFKYDKTKDKRRSNCAAFAYQSPDKLFPTQYDDMFVLKYAYREESTRAANEDVLKMAWWCGCEVLFERNINHWKNDFSDWGCSRFLTWMPGEVEPGMASTNDTIQTICNYTEAYINRFIGKVYFKSLIRKDTGWLGFKVEDTEKFDEPVAAGITLIKIKMRAYNQSNHGYNIEDYFPRRRRLN